MSTLVWDPVLQSIVSMITYPNEMANPPLAVPLPAPVWLGSVGLLALLIIRRRITI